MGVVYSSLDDVQRVLLSAKGEKIRTPATAVYSISVREVTKNNNVPFPTFSFNKASVEVDAAFSGTYKLMLVFTSATEFTAYAVESPTDHKQLIGTGVTSADFSTTNSEVTLRSAGWIGTPEVGKALLIDILCHISDDYVEQYINQVESMIDATLQEWGYLERQTDGASLLFDKGQVPSEIKYAAAYMTAYYIVTDLFVDIMKDNDESSNMVIFNRHKKRAEEFLMKFFKYSVASPPRIFVFPKKLDKIGIPDIGPGMESATSDLDELSRDAQNDDLFG